jgi:hypothetical protein
MTRKIAVKRLTRSDLTLFRWHFEHHNAGNQKAINLNREVFIDALFPSLPVEAQQRGGRFPLDLSIYGPGERGDLNLQRKIRKTGTYKNWRLNGEFIPNPPDDPTRFDSLAVGDIAVIEFGGTHYPESARMCLVDRQSRAGLHQVFADFLGSRPMAAINGVELDALLEDAGVAGNFPIGGKTLEETIEEAALGGVEAAQRLAARSARPVTKEELQRARRRAEESGDAGEEFVNAFLELQQTSGSIDSFRWVSLDNAAAAFDFEVSDGGGSFRIDVKATSGPFTNRIHVSANELLHMADPAVPYRVYRVYELTEESAKLRISGPLKPLADAALLALQSLPAGIRPDGISIDPAIIAFGPERELSLPSAGE